MVRKIALEEHFLCPGFEDYWKTTVGNVDPAIYRHVHSALRDFGELRLKAMDEAGITRAVLSLAGPSVPQGARMQRLPGARGAAAARPLFRLRPRPAAGPDSGRRRARALRARARL